LIFYDFKRYLFFLFMIVGLVNFTERSPPQKSNDLIFISNRITYCYLRITLRISEILHAQNPTAANIVDFVFFGFLPLEGSHFLLYTLTRKLFKDLRFGFYILFANPYLLVLPFEVIIPLGRELLAVTPSANEYLVYALFFLCRVSWLLPYLYD
jgi:hypothetical protein